MTDVYVMVWNRNDYIEHLYNADKSDSVSIMPRRTAMVHEQFTIDSEDNIRLPHRVVLSQPENHPATLRKAARRTNQTAPVATAITAPTSPTSPTSPTPVSP